LPGTELELDLEEDLTRERLKDLLKGLSGIQFGAYSAYSVINKEHSNDGSVTFHVPAPKSVSDSSSKGNNEKPRMQCGQLIEQIPHHRALVGGYQKCPQVHRGKGTARAADVAVAGENALACLAEGQAWGRRHVLVLEGE
jgi:hypothetical protein